MKALIAGFAAATILVAALAATPDRAQAQQANQINAAQNIGQHASSNTSKLNGSDDTKAKANDKAYSSALKNLPDKQYDPWRGVR
jgi:predicted secreted protein